jgi:hypothetical protein
MRQCEICDEQMTLKELKQHKLDKHTKEISKESQHLLDFKAKKSFNFKEALEKDEQLLKIELAKLQIELHEVKLTRLKRG